MQYHFETDVYERAVFAYFLDRYKHRKLKHPKSWPDYDKSGVFRYNARDYFVLRGSRDQVLAVFRIQPSNGTLRRLHNYPLALQHPPSSGKGAQELYFKKG